MSEQSVATYETLTPALQTEIEAAFDQYWDVASASRASHIDADELAERREKALSNEFGFARKIIAAADEMSVRHDGPVVFLFDVDETIARNEYGTNPDNPNEPKTYVRPAFTPTIRAVKDTLGDRLEVGLLTSRSQSHIDEQLDHPTYMAGVMDTVNPEFVLSSRDGKMFTSIYTDTDGSAYEDWDNDLRMLNNSDRVEDIFEYCGDIIKPELLQEIREVGYSKANPMWWNIKVGILQKIANAHPERAFVFVEDMGCADSIRDDHPQVMGVRAYEGAGFFSI